MDRRQFIQTLNALSVGSAVSATALAKPKQSVVDTNTTATLTEPISVGEGSLVDYDRTKIGVIAVGGISRSILRNLHSRLTYPLRTIAIDTDAESLQRVSADKKIEVGCGSVRERDPQGVRILSNAVVHEIADAVAGLDMVLLVAGLGGGAGTGISPVVAKVLRQQNILTLCVAVASFDFEGEKRQKIAQSGIHDLGTQGNALIPIRNSDMALVVDQNGGVDSAMAHAPLAFIQICRSITNSMAPQPDYLGGVDFHDLKRLIMSPVGHGAFGFGSASGIHHGVQAATELAINHPFLGQRRLQQASAVLVTIEASPGLLFLRDSKDVCSCVKSVLPPNSSVRYSNVYTKPDDGHDFRVSILASGIQEI